MLQNGAWNKTAYSHPTRKISFAWQFPRRASKQPPAVSVLWWYDHETWLPILPRLPCHHPPTRWCRLVSSVGDWTSQTCRRRCVYRHRSTWLVVPRTRTKPAMLKSTSSRLNRHNYSTAQLTIRIFMPNLPIKKVRIALYGEIMTELRSVTFYMGWHSVTCYPTQVSVPALTSAMQAGTRVSIYLPRRGGKLSWHCYSETQTPGAELATFRSRIQCLNHWVTKQQGWLVKVVYEWLSYAQQELGLVCSQCSSWVTCLNERCIHPSSIR